MTVKKIIIIYNDGLPQTRTTLGQLCAALWESQSQPVVIQPGIKPGSVVKPLALRCNALDRCATQEPKPLRGFKLKFGLQDRFLQSQTVQAF